MKHTKAVVCKLCWFLSGKWTELWRVNINSALGCPSPVSIMHNMRPAKDYEVEARFISTCGTWWVK